MEFKLSPQIKRSILENELTQVEGEMYRMSLRHAVQEKLGRKDQCELIEKDMENIQAAVQIYREELETIMAEIESAKAEAE